MRFLFKVEALPEGFLSQGGQGSDTIVQWYLQNSIWHST